MNTETAVLRLIFAGNDNKSRTLTLNHFDDNLTAADLDTLAAKIAVTQAIGNGEDNYYAALDAGIEVRTISRVIVDHR